MKPKHTHNIEDTGFTVPSDYFKNLEDTLLSHAKLNTLPDSTGFKIPDAYFETIEKNILKQVSEKDDTKVISIFNKKSLLYISSIAAAILLLFNLSIFETNTTWDSLDPETVENYLINENIGAYEIALTLENIDFSEENFVNEQVNENTLENYLIEHIDIEDLIIE